MAIPTKLLGETGEHLVASLCSRRGYTVAKAPETTKGFDLFAEMDDEPVRIQVKTGHERKNSNWVTWQRWGFEFLAVVWFANTDDMLPEAVWVIPESVLRKLAQSSNMAKSPHGKAWYLRIPVLRENFETYRWL